MDCEDGQEEGQIQDNVPCPQQAEVDSQQVKQLTKAAPYLRAQEGGHNDRTLDGESAAPTNYLWLDHTIKAHEDDL